MAAVQKLVELGKTTQRATRRTRGRPQSGRGATRQRHVTSKRLNTGRWPSRAGWPPLAVRSLPLRSVRPNTLAGPSTTLKPTTPTDQAGMSNIAIIPPVFEAWQEWAN